MVSWSLFSLKIELDYFLLILYENLAGMISILSRHSQKHLSCFQFLFPHLKIPSYNKFSKCDICFATNLKKRKFKSLQEKRISNTCFQNKSNMDTLIFFFQKKRKR